jgi:hypothetical protein
VTIFDYFRYPIKETESGCVDYDDIRKLPQSIWDRYYDQFLSAKGRVRGTDLMRKIIMEWDGEPDDDI